MAVFGNQVDPEKIIGMKPEELKAKLDSAVTKEDLTKATEQFGQITAGLAELKQQLSALTTPKAEPIVEDPTDPTTKLLLDPKGMIRDETKGLHDAQIQTQAQLQEMRARQNPALAGVFAKYGNEMVAMAEKMPLSQRAQPGFWEWHARTFVGDKVITGKIEKDSYPSLIGSSTIGVREDGDKGDPNMGFDAPVAEWLKGRNIPLAKAARIQEIMGKNGDPIQIANYKAGNA
jgi:hypothetical protein